MPQSRLTLTIQSLLGWYTFSTTEYTEGTEDVELFLLPQNTRKTRKALAVRAVCYLIILSIVALG